MPSAPPVKHEATHAIELSQQSLGNSRAWSIGYRFELRFAILLRLTALVADTVQFFVGAN